MSFYLQLINFFIAYFIYIRTISGYSMTDNPVKATISTFFLIWQIGSKKYEYSTSDKKAFYKVFNKCATECLWQPYTIHLSLGNLQLAPLVPGAAFTP